MTQLPQAPPPQQSSAPTSGKAIASLVVGILSLCTCPVVMGAVAIWLGQSAKQDIAARGLNGKGMATAGIVLGCIALVLFVIGVVVRLATM